MTYPNSLNVMRGKRQGVLGKWLGKNIFLREIRLGAIQFSSFEFRSLSVPFTLLSEQASRAAVREPAAAYHALLSELSPRMRGAPADAGTSRSWTAPATCSPCRSWWSRRVPPARPRLSSWFAAAICDVLVFNKNCCCYYHDIRHAGLRESGRRSVAQ